MSGDQAFDDPGAPQSQPADPRAVPTDKQGARRGVQPGGREADGVDAAPRALGEDSLESELESDALDDLTRDVRLKLTGPRRGSSRTRRASASERQPHLRPAQRLLILDTWLRSKLPAREFCAMFGLSPHTLYSWKQRFDE